MKKNFEEFLQYRFMSLREIGGIPITKDNCEDMFSSWLENREISELIDYGDEYAENRYNTIVRLLKEHKDNNISPDMAYQGALVDVLEIIKGL
jgi:hypothetical protein